MVVVVVAVVVVKPELAKVKSRNKRHNELELPSVSASPVI